MPAAYVGDANSLFWNFISFPRKPSYSASFLHWIFSLSYPYLTTLYIFNSIVSWLPKPSPLRNPWLLRGWTPVSWRRKWQPTPVFLPGKFHGWRSLVGYSPWGCKELDTNEQLYTFYNEHNALIPYYVYIKYIHSLYIVLSSFACSKTVVKICKIQRFRRPLLWRIKSEDDRAI